MSQKKRTLKFQENIHWVCNQLRWRNSKHEEKTLIQSDSYKVLILFLIQCGKFELSQQFHYIHIESLFRYQNGESKDMQPNKQKLDKLTDDHHKTISNIKTDEPRCQPFPHSPDLPFKRSIESLSNQWHDNISDNWL